VEDEQVGQGGWAAGGAARASRRVEEQDQEGEVAQGGRGQVVNLGVLIY